MRDQPDAANLISECRRLLGVAILPGLAGEERLALLMVLSALGMAEREMAAEPAFSQGLQSIISDHAASAGQLVAAIRAGEHDASQTLHQSLKNATLLLMMVTKPKALADEDLELAKSLLVSG